MNRVAPIISARLLTRLPSQLHYRGEPTAWVQMTRPGQSLHSFLEGIQFDAASDIWLCDVPYGRIFRISPDLTWHIHYQYQGEPHSIRSNADGHHIVVDYQRGLLKFDGQSSDYGVLADSQAEGFKGLSDLTIAPDGCVWFTDSGRTSLSDPSGGLYRLNAEGTLDCRLNNVPYPNGVAVSPCGTFVYLAATRANAIWRLLANAPDTGRPMVGVHIHLSGGLGPDGLAVNANGYLAVAQAQAGRAYVFDTLGDLVAEVRLPEGLWTTAVAFHPQQQNTLYITEAQTGSIYVANIHPQEQQP